MNPKILIVLLIYMGIILWLSLQPIPENAKELFPFQDKVVHFILYFFLAVIMYLGLKKSTVKYSYLKLWIIPVIFSIVYGGLIEICQIFVPTRSFDYNDIIVNTFGGISGSSLIQFLTKSI
ncbi:MAG: VanZ family protein [Candidatus Hydrogenedentes bacterium]|nr:VanZ family protein [Candidatus Hydrogenedentota bacterium]